MRSALTTPREALAGRVTEVRGTAIERASQQAEAHPGVLEHAYSSLATLPLLPLGLSERSRAKILRVMLDGLGAFYLRRDRRILEWHAGGTFARGLEAMARVHGVSPARVYGLQAFEIESARPSFRLGCTAVAVSPAQHRDGSPALLYNHDFPPVFGRYLILRRAQPAAGLRSVAVTYPMMLGAVAGVNEAGLALAVNQAFATDLQRARPGLLVTLLAQDCLDRCRTVAEAAELIERTSVTTGALVTLADASGDRVVMELCGTWRGPRHPADSGLLVAFNKYHLGPAERLEVPVGAVTTGLGAGYDIHRPNLRRQTDLADWRRANPPPYSTEALLGLLADHGGKSGDGDTICCHGDAMNQTILSAMLWPKERAIDVWAGLACQARFERVALF